MRKVIKEKLDEGQLMYRLLRNAHRRFGMARFEIGAMLLEIKDRELWQGRATSFAAFIEEERINSSAAYMYMRVAKRLFRELQLDDREFERIATVNMTTLDMACQAITEDNKYEVLDMLEALGERDAKQELQEMVAEQSGGGMLKRDSKVNKALSGFFDLPDDLRIDFLNNIQKYYGNGAGQKQTVAA